jgi:hypothetical protein
MKSMSKIIIQFSSSIVLILVAILVAYFKFLPTKRPEHCIEIIYPGDEERYPDGRGFIVPVERTYILSSISDSNKRVLSRLTQKLSCLKVDNDKETTLRVRINDKTSWQDYINFLDVCMKDPTVVQLFNNDIWVHVCDSREVRSNKRKVPGPVL